MAGLITAYIFILIAFVLFSAAGIYHLWRFGYSGDASKPIIITYSAVALVIILATFIIINARIIEG